jgi:(p)ppGpp synthase/HD superfamily hydrolase
MMIAVETHGGDRNKHDGEMYTLHLARVWINVRDAGGDEVQQAIAWLHDSIEDTPLTFLDLRAKLVTSQGHALDADRVVQGVRGMTKVIGETNEEYYHRCRENEDSRFVKLHGDLVDNFRRNHQITDPATKERMTHKYSLGMDILS